MIFVCEVETLKDTGRRIKRIIRKLKAIFHLSSSFLEQLKSTCTGATEPRDKVRIRFSYQRVRQEPAKSIGREYYLSTNESF